ncbi:hypothetical protein N7522_012064 [Penicillium canescens]|uniref:F-box domain-containing protein n=1 Tax=Penicillium canescens TaxID=5083 RepID=A0AAD6HZU6_PENCN|nr:uncharacterized protein N7446_013885 [Penicillium canescens]KAJ5984868.1 hypothetical protein N7522_012064 [Penicillium canescens]KAJ6023520.1 hypothetical protein N7460_013915 [Penicillium canescens]KAJ6025205.1 hypothetical protein N7444_012884 [Penicillium canescens]KAJ6042819.1 hypothetical protein N7446_013885 [Penicillium canescens]
MRPTETIPVPLETSNPPVPTRASGTKEAIRDQSQPDGFKEEEINASTVGKNGEDWPSSPQEPLQTIIDLNTPQESENEFVISPLSDNHPREATVARSFPELSHSLESPTSPDLNMKHSSLKSLEEELRERVQILCGYSEAVETGLEEETGDLDVIDCASSCYSRRTSLASVGTEWYEDGPLYKSADAYSICSPVAAGVFDDDTSPRSSRPQSTLSHRLYAPNSLARPHKSITRELSMNDLKNKPLPLEPGSASPTRRSDSSLSAAPPRSNSPFSEFSQKDMIVSPLYRKSARAHTHRNSYACQSCGHSKPRPRPRRDFKVAGHRARRVPTLSQAAEELEDALADFEGGAHRTLLILDGPLQISRNNGDLIATRPAPLPPSTKPHSSQSRADAQVKNRASIKPVASPPKEKPKISKPKDKKDKSRRSRDEEKRDNTSLKKDKKSQKSFLMPFRKSQDPDLQTSATLTSDAASLDSASNREDLLLQLPRLQTRISGNPFDQVAQQAQALVDIPQPPAQAPVELSDCPTAPDVHLRIRPSNDRVVSKMRQSWAWVSTAQASSFQLPEHVYELDAAPPSPFAVVPPAAPTAFNVQVEFPEDMPIDLILSIMNNIDSLDDLFNFVLVNKKFYSTFKRHELPMIKNALFKMSPPAWELREMSPPWETEWQLLLDPDSQVPEYTPTLYLQRYAQDIYTLAKLKALVLARCAPFLRPDTVRGLAGVDNTRAEEVDDAFWRVWTFCRIFGSGKNREADITGQMDWLKGGVMARNMFNSASSMSEPFGINNVLFEPPEGFGRGNLDGLSQRQMYDITEIWTCMSVLLQPLHGKCIEARKVGIFDGMNVPEGDAVREETVLEEWTSYVLSLGLSAVLSLSAVCPADTTVATFTKAQSIGLTKWEPTETGASRSPFLKEAVARAYELQERALSPQSSISEGNRSSSPSDSSREIRERQAGFARELCHRRRVRGPSNEPEGRYSFSAERPMSEFSTIVRNLDGSIRDEPPVPPVPALVLGRCSTSSSGSGSDPHTPIQASNHTSVFAPSQTPPAPAVRGHVPLPPQVLDPVDRAINTMVNEMGFNTEDAKWALKITDTGEGIDVSAAIQLLEHQRKKNERNPFGKRNTLLSAVIKRQKSQEAGWRWA